MFTRTPRMSAGAKPPTTPLPKMAAVRTPSAPKSDRFLVEKASKLAGPKTPKAAPLRAAKASPQGSGDV